jgi:hypothetical protein
MPTPTVTAAGVSKPEIHELHEPEDRWVRQVPLARRMGGDGINVAGKMNPYDDEGGDEKHGHACDAVGVW